MFSVLKVPKLGSDFCEKCMEKKSIADSMKDSNKNEVKL